MKRNIIYSGESTEVWNKHTVKSKKFKTLVGKQLSKKLDEELNKPLPFKNFDCQSFTFLISQNLLNKQCYSHLAHNSIQTIGRIKIDDGFWFYSLSDNQDVRIKLLFACNKIWQDSSREMYARIYGCCKFYEREENKMTKHPDDCTGPPYMEIIVYTYINLNSYNEARILEKDLYDKNYEANKT